MTEKGPYRQEMETAARELRTAVDKAKKQIESTASDKSSWVSPVVKIIVTSAVAFTFIIVVLMAVGRMTGCGVSDYDENMRSCREMCSPRQVARLENGCVCFGGDRAVQETELMEE